MKYIYLFFCLTLFSCRENKAVFETQWEMTDIVNVHPTFQNQYIDSLSDVHFEYYVRIKNVSQDLQIIDSNTFVEFVDNNYLKLVPINKMNEENLPLPKISIGPQKEIQLVFKSAIKKSWFYDETKISKEVVKPSEDKLNNTRLFYITKDTFEVIKSKKYFNF